MYQQSAQTTYFEDCFDQLRFARWGKNYVQVQFRTSNSTHFWNQIIFPPGIKLFYLGHNSIYQISKVICQRCYRTWEMGLQKVLSSQSKPTKNESVKEAQVRAVKVRLGLVLTS